MGIEEFFEARDKYSGNYREQKYPANTGSIDYSRRSSNEEDQEFNWLNILEKIKSNKKFRIYVILAGLLVLTILGVLIIVLYPTIIKLINGITQTGLQGVLNDITGFLDQILNGTAK